MEEIYEKIKTIIKERGFANLGEIAKGLGVNRITAAKYLAYLVGRGEIKEKKYGKVRVFYI